MFTTMEVLDKPFVEWALTSNEWLQENIMTNAAVSYTYDVPHNWYPAWAGMLLNRYRFYTVDERNNNIMIRLIMLY